MTHADVTILFDLDGTLIETAPDLVGTLSDVVTARGHPPLDAADVRPFIGYGARAMISRALGVHGDVPDADELDALFRDYLETYERRIADLSHPFPGMVEALDALEAEGARFAVCTNKRSNLAKKLLDALGLSARFLAIAGPDTYGAAKPDRLFVDSLMRDVAARPGRTVFVGDSRIDVEAARNAGLPVVGVTFGYTEIPMTELSPDVLVDHFDELPAAIRQVLRAAA